MLRKIILIVMIMVSVSNPVLANTETFKTELKHDYTFTDKTPFIFKNEFFTLDNTYSIIPMIEINGLNFKLSQSSLDYSYDIKDYGYKYKWSLNLSKPALTVININSVNFNIKNCAKYDEYTMHCGNIELDFSDLVYNGYNISITNNNIKINGTGINNEMIYLDPTAQYLPNTNNKAYKNTTSSASCNFIAKTEFTTTEYGNVNVSDDLEYSLTISIPKLLYRCTNYIFEYNISQISITSITDIKIFHEGYFIWNGQIGDADSKLYYYNNTNSTWIYYGILNQDSDTIVIKNFTSGFSNLINSSGIIKFGLLLDGWAFALSTKSLSSRTDFAYVNITYTSADTCTYSDSGNWFININDNCTLSTSNTVNGNVYIYGSNGWLNFQANQYAHSFYYNVTSLGSWYYNNYRWVY